MHTARTLLTAAAVAALLTGCATTRTTTAAATSPATASASASANPIAAVSDWWTGGGQTRLNTVTADMTAVTKASGPDATASACQQLVTDLTAAQVYAPIPDAQAEASWSSALAHLHQGASDCAAGAANQDATQMATASQEITEGNTDLTAATTRLQAINSGQ